MLIYQGLGMIFGLLIAYITGKIDGKTLKLLSIIVLYILFGIIACNILYETMVSAATFQYKIEEQSGVATLAYEQFVHSKIIKWNVGVYTSQLVGLIIGYFRIKRNKKHENLKIRKEEKNIPDDVYRQIAEELQANKRDSMLMVKAIAQSKGDKALAESLYIQLRAEYIVSTLQNEEKKKQRETETLHRESESVVQTKKAQAWSKGEELEGIQKAEEQARQDKNEEGIDGLGRFWLIFFVIIFLIAIVAHEMDFSQSSSTAPTQQPLATQPDTSAPASNPTDAQTQYNWGLAYYEGDGVSKNFIEAARRFRLSADQGNAEAQFYLGLLYSNGWGMTQDYTEAVKWFSISAGQGNAYAQYNLGVIYANGQGVPQNHTEATKWFRMAANQGMKEAQTQLGLAYAKGENSPSVKNNMQSLKDVRK